MTKPNRDARAGQDRPLQRPSDPIRATDSSEQVGAGHAPPAAELEKRLAEVEKERDEYLADLQRVAAEFENYRKRVARDQQSLAARAHERLVKELLPVLDDLERTLAAADGGDDPRAGHAPPLLEGVRLVHRELQEALAKEGLAEIETNGRFDPHVHEALLSQPSDEEEGAILDVLQKGYRLGDRVLRPARVVVSQGK
jgi:molecular chaperone GrpE